MGLEVGGRAAIERLSGTPQSFLTATRGARRERERKRDWQQSSLSQGWGRDGELSSLSPGRPSSSSFMAVPGVSVLVPSPLLRALIVRGHVLSVKSCIALQRSIVRSNLEKRPINKDARHHLWVHVEFNLSERPHMSQMTRERQKFKHNSLTTIQYTAVMLHVVVTVQTISQICTTVESGITAHLIKNFQMPTDLM